MTNNSTQSDLRILGPLVNDLYDLAKDSAKTAIAPWRTKNAQIKIVRMLKKIEMVKTIWSPEKDVPISSFYYPAKLQEISTANATLKLSDFPNDSIIIQGVVGQGKSIFLRHLAATAIRSGRAQIPVFIELRSITDAEGLRDRIHKILKTLDVGSASHAFDHLAKSGKCALLLDGFDEVKPELVPRLIEEIEDIQNKYSEFLIIVTARPGSEIQKVTGFKIFNVKKLRPEDYDAFLRKMNIAGGRRKPILDAISESKAETAGVISSPLMLTLVVLVYESDKLIPKAIPEFFERLFNVVFTRHDKLKAGFERTHKCGLSERRLRQLFEAFCFVVADLEYGRSLSGSQFETAFDKALIFGGSTSCDVCDFREDLTKVACLMLEEGLDQCTFLHKSILDYYSARFVKTASDESAKLFYERTTANYKKWSAVLYFLSEIDPYRYNLWYFLSVAQNALDELQDVLAKNDDIGLIAYIQRYLPDLAMHVNHKPKDSRASWQATVGPIAPATSDAHKELASHVARAFVSSLSGVTDGEIVEHGRPSNVLRHETVYELAGAALSFGTKEFRAELELFAKLLSERIRSARAVVKREKARMQLFQTV